MKPELIIEIETPTRISPKRIRSCRAGTRLAKIAPNRVPTTEVSPATSSAGQISSNIVERNHPTTFRTCRLLRAWSRHSRAPQTIDIDRWDEIFLFSVLSSVPCFCARRLHATARAVSPKRGDAGFVPFVCVGRRRISRHCVSLAALGGLLFT